MNFFDQSFFQNLVVSILIFLISLLLGNKPNTPSTVGKGWKITNIIAWIMILLGAYLFVLNFPNGHFNNIYGNLGFCMFFLGLPLKYISKFFIWWNR